MTEEQIKVIAMWLRNYSPKHDATESGWAIIPGVVQERYAADAKEVIELIFASLASTPDEELVKVLSGYLAGYDQTAEAECEEPEVMMAKDLLSLIAPILAARAEKHEQEAVDL